MKILPEMVLELIEHLTILPGVGPKSAQRMAVHLLLKKPEEANKLAISLDNTLSMIKKCTKCRSLTIEPICNICLDEQRDKKTICVIENISDLLSLEQTGTYRGQYFILMGSLSPIDRIGPDELGIPLLINRVEQEAISEVILATNPTIEGEATAHYLTKKLPKDSKITRLASGIPVGTELTYVNDHTLFHALSCRKEVERI